MTVASIAGRRVLVTRAQEEAEQWAERLVGLGATALVFPCLVYVPIGDPALATTLTTALASAGWMLVTSPRGADAAARLLDGALPQEVRIAVVGATTERACVALFGRVNFVAPRATSAALGETLGALLALAQQDSKQRVLIIGAAGGRDDAEAALVASGASVTRVDVYRTIPSPAVPRKLDLSAAGIDDIFLTSPSAVTGLLNTADLPAGARVITIGPTTSAAARAAGLHVASEAREPTFEGMLEALS